MTKASPIVKRIVVAPISPYAKLWFSKFSFDSLVSGSTTFSRLELIGYIKKRGGKNLNSHTGNFIDID